MCALLWGGRSRYIFWKSSQIGLKETSRDRKLSDLTVQTLGGDKTLTRKLKFAQPRGKSVLIMGARGKISGLFAVNLGGTALS